MKTVEWGLFRREENLGLEKNEKQREFEDEKSSTIIGCFSPCHDPLYGDDDAKDFIGKRTSRYSD